MNRRRIVNAVKIAIALGLVAFVLSQVPLSERVDPETGRPQPGLLTYVGGMDPWLFAFGALFYFVGVTISGVRWWWLLKVNDLDVSLPRAVRFTWIGVFFNNVIPGLTGGDVVKAVYVARATGKKLRPVLSVLVDRVLGLVALALLAAFVVLFELDDPSFRALAGVLWAGLAVLLVGVVVFLSRRVRQRLRFDALLRRLPGHRALMQLDQAITLYRGHLRGVAVWLLLSIGNHLIFVCGVVLIGNALHGDMPALRYLVLVPCINIVSALPLAPAGWGIGETAYKIAWERFGPGAVADAALRTRFGTQGVALSLVYRVQTMLWSLVGVLCLVLERDHRVPDEAELRSLEIES